MERCAPESFGLTHVNYAFTTKIEVWYNGLHVLLVSGNTHFDFETPGKVVLLITVIFDSPAM